jgi:hypothetical protein
LRANRVRTDFAFRRTVGAPIKSTTPEPSKRTLDEAHEALKELWIDRTAPEWVWRLEPSDCTDCAFESHV